MQTSSQHFTRTHFKILLVFVLVFSALSAFWMSQQSPSDRRGNWNVATVVFTFLGPFAGAITRHLESGGLHFSLGLYPYCAAFLFAAVICQFVPLPFRRGQSEFRIVAWVVGLLGWFLGAPISFLGILW
jgi:hypothetical protein